MAPTEPDASTTEHTPEHARSASPPASEPVPRHAVDPLTATSGSTPGEVDAPAPELLAQRAAPSRTKDGVRSKEPTTLGGHVVAFVRELSVVVVGALVISTLLRVFVAQMYDIPSPSMHDSLQIGDRVLVEKISQVQRGQVVVFHDPGGWLNDPGPQRGPLGQAMEFVGLLPASSDHIVKRVVGMPGDQVICCDPDGRITVNGHPLVEPYVVGQPPSVIRFRVEVPADHLFVLGDNRANSRDSRCHLNDPGTVVGAGAFVPTADVVGRGVAVVWPRAHWQSLDPPPSYGGIPTGRNPARDHPVIEAGPEARC